MKDIKERVRDKNPKIRNPAARLPKELVRSAVLEAKEKPRELHEKSSGQSESPTQYGTEKIESVQYRAASVAGKSIGKTTYQGGKKLAGVTYRKIKERKSRQEEAKAAEEAMEQGAESGKKLIKLKPEQAALAKENGKRQVKAAPRVVKVSGLSQEKIKTQASMQKQQMEKSLQAMQKARAAQMARKSAQASAESGKAVLQVTGKGSKLSVQGITAAIQKGVVALEKMGKWIAAGGSAFLLVFILIVGIIAGAAFSSNSESSESLSEEVLAYTSVIQQYASQYGIPEYVSAIQAIMMQESGGRGTDPMQCSESPYNTRFPHTPGSITDPDYSIEVGVQTFADCIRQAGCSSPQDLDKLKLAWQGYNYGNGYIGWALQRGGYTEANALQFSQEQAASHGWSSYGDPQYVPHVMRYYSGGSLFAGLFGNQQIVSVAMGQLGNSGGQKFWSWYGFDSRVEWCACFVSWCADQSGLIASGNVPKFSLCSDGVSWFQGKNKWQSGGTTPTAGMIIFFDWDHDGTSDHVVASAIHLVFHECGHFFGGLVSKYKLLFFRFGPFNLVKTEKTKIKFTWLKTHGGQCVMYPSQTSTIKYKAYNLGGVIANAIIAALSTLLMLPNNFYLLMMMIELVFVGAYKILVNLIPHKTNGVPNDGYIVKMLDAHIAMRKDYALYLRIYADTFLNKAISPSDYQYERNESLSDDETKIGRAHV